MTAYIVQVSLGRGAAWHAHVQDHIRRRVPAVPDDAVHERRRPLPRFQVEGEVRVKAPATRFNPRLQQRHRIGSLFYGLFVISIGIGIIGLLVLIVQVLVRGLPWLSWGFISSYPAPDPSEAGLLAALAGHDLADGADRGVYCARRPRGRDLPGGVRGREPVHQVRGSEHLEPCGSAVHHLRTVGGWRCS